MAYTLNQSLSEFLYNKLPTTYRKRDSSLQLKKYIESLVEGGLLPTLNKILDISKLLDPENCPSEFLPYLFSNYGMEYEPNIEEVFQRRLLVNLPEIFKIKGTKSVIRYLAREVTGFDVTVTEQLYTNLFMTWMSNETLDKKGITLSKTFDSGNADVKYTVGSLYNPFRVFIQLQGTSYPTDNQIYALFYYLEKFIPAHINFQVTFTYPEGSLTNSLNGGEELVTNIYTEGQLII